jgi:hypothetical protein
MINASRSFWMRILSCGQGGFPAGRSILEKLLEEIEGILEKREEDECVIGKDLFGKDYRDSSIYHIVLNTGLLSIDQEFEIVSAGLGKKRV